MLCKWLLLGHRQSSTLKEYLMEKSQGYNIDRFSVENLKNKAEYCKLLPTFCSDLHIKIFCAKVHQLETVTIGVANI